VWHTILTSPVDSTWLTGCKDYVNDITYALYGYNIDLTEGMYDYEWGGTTPNAAANIAAGKDNTGPDSGGPDNGTLTPVPNNPNVPEGGYNPDPPEYTNDVEPDPNY